MANEGLMVGGLIVAAGGIGTYYLYTKYQGLVKTNGTAYTNPKNGSSGFLAWLLAGMPTTWGAGGNGHGITPATNPTITLTPSSVSYTTTLGVRSYSLSQFVISGTGFSYPNQTINVTSSDGENLIQGGPLILVTGTDGSFSQTVVFGGLNGILGDFVPTASVTITATDAYTGKAPTANLSVNAPPPPPPLPVLGVTPLSVTEGVTTTMTFSITNVESGSSIAIGQYAPGASYGITVVNQTASSTGTFTATSSFTPTTSGTWSFMATITPPLSTTSSYSTVNVTVEPPPSVTLSSVYPTTYTCTPTGNPQPANITITGSRCTPNGLVVIALLDSTGNYIEATTVTGADQNGNVNAAIPSTLLLYDTGSVAGTYNGYIQLSDNDTGHTSNKIEVSIVVS